MNKLFAQIYVPAAAVVTPHSIVEKYKVQQLFKRCMIFPLYDPTISLDLQNVQQ
jgi:hypothetical protein